MGEIEIFLWLILLILWINTNKKLKIVLDADAIRKEIGRNARWSTDIDEWKKEWKSISSTWRKKFK